MNSVRAVRGLVRIAVIAAATVALCAVPASADHQQRVKRLQRALDHLVEIKGGPPGASAVLYRGARERFLHAGVADVKTGKPFRRQKQMRIASVSKAFSGAIALALVVAMAIGPLLRWRRDDAGALLDRLIWPIAAAGFTGATLVVLAPPGVLPLFGIALAAGLAVASVLPLVGRNLLRTPLFTWGMVVAHLGIAVSLAGMACDSAYTSETLIAARVGQPVRDLLLHHDQPAADGGEAGQQVQQHRDGHVVGQIRHQGGRLGGQLLHAHGVLLEHGQPPGPLGAQALHRVRQLRRQRGVDLHRHDLLGGVQQRRQDLRVVLELEEAEHAPAVAVVGVEVVVVMRADAADDAAVAAGQEQLGVAVAEERVEAPREEDPPLELERRDPDAGSRVQAVRELDELLEVPSRGDGLHFY